MNRIKTLNQMYNLHLISLLALLGMLGGCAPFVAGAAVGGAGGYVIGREVEYYHYEPLCWNQWVGTDYYGQPVYEQYCR